LNGRKKCKFERLLFYIFKLKNSMGILERERP